MESLIETTLTSTEVWPRPNTAVAGVRNWDGDAALKVAVTVLLEAAGGRVTCSCGFSKGASHGNGPDLIGEEADQLPECHDLGRG